MIAEAIEVREATLEEYWQYFMRDNIDVNSQIWKVHYKFEKSCKFTLYIVPVIVVIVLL